MVYGLAVERLGLLRGPSGSPLQDRRALTFYLHLKMGEARGAPAVAFRGRFPFNLSFRRG